MSMGGWYPDPSGAPGRFRYWDGQTWSAQTTADPARAPIPDDAARPGRSRPDKGNRGWLVALVVLALVTVLVVVFVVTTSGRNPLGAGGATEDTNSSTPTVSAWDETSTPTTPPPTDFTNGELVACPTTRHTADTPQRIGRLAAGALSIATASGWDGQQTWHFPFTYDLHYQTMDIVTTEWFAGLSVGRLAKDDWQGGISSIATQISQCIATSGYYTAVTGTATTRTQSLSIDGHAAWWVTEDIYVSDPPHVQGDRVDIIVVDVGAGADYYGLFSSACTINPALDKGSCAGVDAAIQSLAVSG